MKVYTHISQYDNPHRNLALEEVLFDRQDADSCFFYLYRNANTVVIGKNQCVWRECRVERLQADGVTLARRITGGGAVYHDMQNLNFSFIVPDALYDVHRQLGVILRALRNLGIHAEFSGRNDLLAEGRKFSGNAFSRRKNASLHHGTLMIGSDMSALALYLQVPEEKMRSKGITSVRNRVINLNEIAPDLTVQTVADELIKAFEDEYGQSVPLPDDLAPEEAAEALRVRNSGWDWMYGASPKSDVTLEKRFDWGGVTMDLSLAKGIIQQADIYSDALDLALIDALRAAVSGARYDAQTLANAVHSMPAQNEQAREELAQWLGGINT